MRCKACDREIRFLRTLDGKTIPLNHPPIRVFIVRDGRAIPVKGYLPHWSTCPHADRFKKKDDDKKQTNLFGE